MRTLGWAVVVVMLVGCGGGGGTGTGGGGGSSTGGGFATGGGGGTSSGGGTGTGGGSSSGGGTGTGGGSSTGGGTATGGGSGTTGGVGTFLRPGFYDQRLAAGADGAMHLLFADGAAQNINYGRCAGGCGSVGAWNVVQLRTTAQLGLTTVGAYGLEVEPGGRVHALLAGVPPFGSQANRIVYATCASGCTTAASWTFLDLSSLTPGANPIGTVKTFMRSATGQLSFLNQGTFNSQQAAYVSCASNCAQLSSWSAGAVLNGNPLHAAVDAAGVTHVMLHQGYATGGEGLLMYARCASGCTQAGSWQVSSLGFMSAAPLYTSGFAVTDSGRVFMAYNQGTLSGTPANQQRLLVNSCLGATMCLALDTWTSFAIGALDEGKAGIGLTTSGEGAVLTGTKDFDLDLSGCDADCHLAASWTAPTAIDTSAAIGQALAPDQGSSCPGLSESAAWWPKLPRVGISTLGVVVVHNPDAVVKCPQNSGPSRTPTIGRVISTY